MPSILFDPTFQGLAGSSDTEEKTYADFVAWQAGLLAGPEGERLWSYWRERLAGLPELDLPADRAKPDRPMPERGGVVAREVGTETLVPLKALARSRRLEAPSPVAGKPPRPNRCRRPGPGRTSPGSSA